MKLLLFKNLLFIGILLSLMSFQTSASDVSCQHELFKPKLIIMGENKVAKPVSKTPEDQVVIEDKEQENKKPIAKFKPKGESKKTKESKFGGLFDILVPATLRDPVK